MEGLQETKTIQVHKMIDSPSMTDVHGKRPRRGERVRRTPTFLKGRQL